MKFVAVTTTAWRRPSWLSRPAALRGVSQMSWKYAISASVSSRERIRKRTPSGASTENPLPRPGTTSTVR
jgi:hypothetical protein